VDRSRRIGEIMNEKIDKAYKILRLGADMSKEFYHQPLIVTYSGGKDSDVILQLALECLNHDEFEVMNSHTTLDAPPTVYHIRETFKRLNALGVNTFIKYPRDKEGKFVSMWTLMPKKLIPPTRIQRYCCQILKEQSTPNRMIATGVRASESTQRSKRNEVEYRERERKKWPQSKYSYEHAQEVFKDAMARKGEPNSEVWDCRLIENARKKKDTIVNPIFTWNDKDVWNYIHDRNVKYNPLYDMGYKRVGCVGCPLGGRKNQLKEFKDFPKYKDLYIKAFDRMVQERIKKQRANTTWYDGKSCFEWWIRDMNQVEGQMKLFEE
jgi:phosphoadenosine phosphosulfate reductase